MKAVNNSDRKTNISRRSFINRAFAGAASVTLAPVLPARFSGIQENKIWPAGTEKLNFHLIGHAHIDPVWLWPWSEGISVVHSTFRSALDRMSETPDFRFTASSAQFYQWVADNDPEMLKEIKQRVEEGRWCIAGGWWVEPDMNIPCGESMVRQGLYGQMTFQKLFGRRSTFAFNPDSFGHTGTLPQIIRSQGMDNYVFMRPGPSEKTIPSDMFWWEGPDGSRVLTYRIPVSYNDSRSVRGRLEQVIEQFKNQPFKNYMSFYGAGDHGGGASRENIASIKEIQSEKNSPNLLFSTPDNFFRDIRKGESSMLPVVKDDLQHHAPGCYTAEAQIKKYNREAESILITAEKIASVGSAVWNYKYPADDFTNAWKKVLFLQFHDSLAGTSVPDHSVSARDGYGYAIETGRYSALTALQKLEWQVPAKDPSSQYIVAFNLHAWEVKAVLEYDLDHDERSRTVAMDENGTILPHQWTAGTTETGRRKGLLVSASLPPLGYRQIRIKEGEQEKLNNPVMIHDQTMENEYLIITFSTTGRIGITDKGSGRDIFRGGTTGCRGVIIDDPSDTWSHGIKAFDKECGEFSNATVRIIENGPVRGIARVVSSYGNSTLTTDWILNAGSDSVEARVTVNWNEKLKMLKFSFPVDVDDPVATYETPYGFIERSVEGNEDPGQRWIDVSGIRDGQQSGLTVINDAKYGYSVSANDMRISILRSAVFAHHNPRILDLESEHIWQDQGIHKFRMVLIPHKDTWHNCLPCRRAEELTSPPLVIYQGIHGGSFPGSGSFLSVDQKNIIVSSIKKAENNDDIIIRCIETHGRETSASLDLKFISESWTGKFRPCEIKTLRIKHETREILEVNLLEEQA